MGKPLQKAALVSQPGEPQNRTILDTTSFTPIEMCDPVSFRAVSNMLRRQFAREVVERFENEVLRDESSLPYSVKKMCNALWDIGMITYDFPDDAGYVTLEENGRYKMVFAYMTEEGSADYEERYIDPDYMDDVREYIERIYALGTDGVHIRPEHLVVEFDSKQAMFHLLCDMIEDAEEFNAPQPEEVCLTTPTSIPADDYDGYVRAKHERHSDEARDEDPEFLLYFAPLKPCFSKAQYIAEANMAKDTPITLNMAHIYEAMVAEGDEPRYRPEVAQRQYYTVGFN